MVEDYDVNDDLFKLREFLRELANIDQEVVSLSIELKGTRQDEVGLLKAHLDALLQLHGALYTRAQALKARMLS